MANGNPELDGKPLIPDTEKKFSLEDESAPRGQRLRADGNTEPEDKPLVPEERAKKPYVKPAFRYEQVFVTTALTCGKMDATEFLCRHNRKVS
jgi:hypothetical protein